MRALTTRLTGISALSLLSLSLSACPGPEGDGDTGPDVPTPRIDAPGADVPGVDAPMVMTDTPMMGMDTPGPVTCTVTGYPALDLEVFASSLSEPVYITGAPGSPDLFVVEKGGRIEVLDSSGAAAGTFLDISGNVRNNGEQGLLGLAFHPDYETNGLFYVYYTDRTTQDQVVARGTRATARTAMPTVTVILRMSDFASNHNGGCIQFGPDGELYIGTGDGGGGGDPMRTGQDINTLLGKMLRIHVDATTGDAYTIPAGNPYAGATPGEDEIYAIGLRNPWRFSFDRATGDLYIGDVGQNVWEEIDVVAAGAGAGLNFGWYECEGFRGFASGAGADCTFADYDPVLVVRHGSDPVLGGGNASINGGYVYRGSAIPGLVGAYLFSDYGSNAVGAFRYCDGAMTEYQELSDLSGLCSGPVSFGQDNAGELYMVCINNGSVRRIIGG